MEMIIIVKPAGKTKFEKMEVDKMKDLLGIGANTDEEEDDSETDIDQSPAAVAGRKSKRKIISKPKAQKKTK